MLPLKFTVMQAILLMPNSVYWVCARASSMYLEAKVSRPVTSETADLINTRKGWSRIMILPTVQGVIHQLRN